LAGVQSGDRLQLARPLAEPAWERLRRWLLLRWLLLRWLLRRGALRGAALARRCPGGVHEHPHLGLCWEQLPHALHGRVCLRGVAPQREHAGAGVRRLDFTPHLIEDRSVDSYC
jgi:hypothetical protein